MFFHFHITTFIQFFSPIFFRISPLSFSFSLHLLILFLSLISSSSTLQLLFLFCTLFSLSPLFVSISHLLYTHTLSPSIYFCLVFLISQLFVCSSIRHFFFLSSSYNLSFHHFSLFPFSSQAISLFLHFLVCFVIKLPLHSTVITQFLQFLLYFHLYSHSITPSLIFPSYSFFLSRIFFLPDPVFLPLSCILSLFHPHSDFSPSSLSLSCSHIVISILFFRFFYLFFVLSCHCCLSLDFFLFL